MNTAQTIKQYRHDVCDEIAAVIHDIMNYPIAILTAIATEDKPELFVHAGVVIDGQFCDIAGITSFEETKDFYAGYHTAFPQARGREYKWQFADTADEYAALMSVLLNREYIPACAGDNAEMTTAANNLLADVRRRAISASVLWSDSDTYHVTLSVTHPDGEVEEVEWSRSAASLPVQAD